MDHWLSEDDSDSDDMESLCSYSSRSDEYTSSEDSSHEVEMTEMEDHLASDDQINDDDDVIPVINENKKDILIPFNSENSDNDQSNRNKNEVNVILSSNENQNDIAIPINNEISDNEQSDKNENLENESKDDKDLIVVPINEISGNEQSDRNENMENESKDDKDLIVVPIIEISVNEQSDRNENMENESKDDKDLIVPSINENSDRYENMENESKDDKDLIVPSINENSDRNENMKNKSKDDKDLIVPSISENLENENKDDKDLIVPLNNENSGNEELNMNNEYLSTFNDWFTVDGTHQKNFLFTDIPRTTEMKALGSQPFKPIDIFNLMVTDNVYNLIVKQTNINAHQLLMNRSISRSSRIKDWRDTDVEEIKKFLAIVMYMGLIRYPSISLYWSKKKFYHNRFISQIMSRNRFQLLLRCIHFADNEKSGTDRLAKVRNLLKMLENNFVAAKTPGETIVVDESMVPWRGGLMFRQYNPRKTHKYGIKVFKLCDLSGYTYTSCVYIGKTKQKEIPTAQTSPSTSIVLDLAKNYLMKGRTVCTDNYYTSISLAKALLKKKTHLLGTLRQNRKENPVCVTAAKLKVGQIIGRENTDGIVVAKWKDKRDVTMLSTKHDLSFVVSANKNKNNEEIRKPKMIVSYNHAKKGVDISDQMASYFSPLRKTIRWYHKIAFEFLLNTAVINSLIIYKEFQKQNQQIAEFRQSIIESLSGMQTTETRSFPTVSKHELQECNERDKRNRKIRRRCSRCYSRLSKTVGRLEALKLCKQITTFCNKCEGNPAFCLECFNEYH
ncbi:UNVERIFIED_CONTAM: hypothetical protein RMT77_002450 [Armadillidium vulgare]